MPDAAKPNISCICGEINARHCPVHNEPETDTATALTWDDFPNTTGEL